SKINMNGARLDKSPVKASMFFSSEMTERQTHTKINFERQRCSGEAFFPAAIPVIPLFNKQGVFGIARITGTGALRCFSMKAVLTDAATDIRICVGLRLSPISDKTIGTV